MNSKPRYFAAALLGALLALASCNPAAPVFYTLEIEQPPAADRGFPDEVTVHRVLKVGSRYFAAANQLYTRTDGDNDNWTDLAFPDFPGTPNNPKCNTLEVFDGSIYAGFFDDSTKDGLGLYRSLPDPISWEQIADFGGASGSQIVLLKAAGGMLFAAIGTWTGDGFEYSLSYSDSVDSGDSGTYTDWGVTLPYPGQLIRDVESDGTYCWVIVGNSMYRNDDIAGVGTFTTMSPPSSGDSYYGGLLYDIAASKLYLSAGNGLLMSSADSGGTWTSSATIVDDNEDPIPFAQFVLPTSDSAGTVYVGTRGYGYFRIPGGDVTPSVPSSYDNIQDYWNRGLRFPSVSFSDLYSGVITALFFDGATDPDTLFLGTAKTGLWRGTHVSGSEWTWDQE